ncbi:MAG: transglutaminase-like domain-containing protein [Akkermansiaceae bacterium]|nr:transglutaminase-like domain-containing protein [Akkermansiaceae bacterium]
MSSSPPKLLAGIALLYWGYLTGHLAAAIPAAIILEARSVVSLRWDFKYESYIKAWHLCILCAALIATVSWIDGMRLGRIHTLFVWAPFIFLPIELAQRFGNAKNIPLSIFSFFARRKMLSDIAEGRKITPRLFNTGYPYITIVILATAKASRHDLYHYLGLSILVGICLYGYTKNNGRRPVAWTCAFILLLALSWLGQWSMYKVFRHYRGGGQQTMLNQTMSATETRTNIGRLGRIKLNPKILWRMKLHGGPKPELLQSATYNEYSKARWLHVPPKSGNSSNYDEFGYRASSSAATAEGQRDIRWFSTDTPTLNDQAPISIIGEVDAKVKEHPLPTPNHFIAIGDLDAEASVECNSLGTIRMANPNYNVIEYAVWLGAFSNTEEPPTDQADSNLPLDLSVPTSERDALKRVCTQLDLYNPSLSTAEKIEKIKNFFIDEFTYSTHLTTPRFDRGKRQSSIGIFLEGSRTGHCEYFASATTLLLREAGIPARYCIGYAVNERTEDKTEWVMRGLHAHAWCRAWIKPSADNDHRAGKWVDVDLTPPSWQSIEAHNLDNWKQRLADKWQRMSEDFLIWRTKETNKSKVLYVLTAILSVVAIWVSWRLWSSRQRKEDALLRPYKRPKNAPHTPLHKLESLVTKKIGRRPTGTPLCEWLHELLLLDVAIENELEESLLPAIALHSAIRFDPAISSAKQHQELALLSRLIKRQLKHYPNCRKPIR